MIIKIFFENKPVFLTDEFSPAVKEFMHHPETIYIDEISTPAVNSLLHEITNPAFLRGILYNANFEKIRKAFYKHFEIIQAAGGVVKNERGEVLFIFRRGKWDLPKGKNDNNEIAKDCAVREVKEETGLIKVKAGKHISTTYHVYKEFGKHILKETEWFNMTALSQEKLIPQLDEGIKKIEWVSAESISDKLKNSYALIAEVLNNAGLKIDADLL
ncbi:MAG: NUDIX domain-containing protein [Ginsengibacter sp.]